MRFDVEITATALADAEEYYLFIRDHQESPLGAERWWSGLVEQILSLESLPLRCPLIPEQSFFAQEIRHLLYGSHRIIFSVDGHTVTVLRIYHSARNRLTAVR